ncbi:aldose epimerase family protein [Nitrospirillum pindoramense]|uniref:Aldose 1-epimerase n=1 Tax=Nitrospirillum amazonense TaxID=28077 RepID=A0A560GUH1_9PROT|nr:aldose epimerase family protein [Nitrospirillum amazonense]TWB37204.1 aldose 1-epimerase [Nitrospirillum amazonense]
MSGTKRTLGRCATVIACLIPLAGAPMAGNPALAATVERAPWGMTPEGERAETLTLSTENARLTLSTYGARMVSLQLPDREGHSSDVLVFPKDPATLAGFWVMAGASVGRFANRIANGAFPLDGRIYQVDRNLGPNTLHGGVKGFDNRMWQAKAVADGVEFHYVSADGEMGFPGTMDVRVTYRLLQQDGQTVVAIDYAATTDKPTVVNLTNHAFFNLAGAGQPLDGQAITLAADRYTPTSPDAIPDGSIVPVDGTRFDLRHATGLDAILKTGGMDQNFVLPTPGSVAPSLAAPVATVTDSASGRVMRVYTTEPGLQFYLPAKPPALNGTPAPGFSLETQHFPDSPNHPAFPSTILRPGQTFQSTTRYVFTIGR